MSKHSPVQVRKLCRRLQPLIQRREARRELAQACGLHHRQQMNHCFPRRGKPPATVRLTTDAALAALRWLEERPEKEKCQYIPSWDELRWMGKHLIRNEGFVAYLANKVGGKISGDQIYSYFSSGRRKPDGEFVLRFLALVAQLRGIRQHPKLGSLLPGHVVDALEVTSRPAWERQNQLRRPMFYALKSPRLRRGQTPSNMIKFRGKKTHLLGVLLGVGPKTELSKYASLW
jgi:hypothetical protein